MLMADLNAGLEQLSPEQRADIKDANARELQFLDFAATHFISALHRTGVGE